MMLDKNLISDLDLYFRRITSYLLFALKEDFVKIEFVFKGKDYSFSFEIEDVDDLEGELKTINFTYDISVNGESMEIDDLWNYLIPLKLGRDVVKNYYEIFKQKIEEKYEQKLDQLEIANFYDLLKDDLWELVYKRLNEVEEHIIELPPKGELPPRGEGEGDFPVENPPEPPEGDFPPEIMKTPPPTKEPYKPPKTKAAKKAGKQKQRKGGSELTEKEKKEKRKKEEEGEKEGEKEGKEKEVEKEKKEKGKWESEREKKTKEGESGGGGGEPEEEGEKGKGEGEEGEGKEGSEGESKKGKGKKGESKGKAQGEQKGTEGSEGEQESTEGKQEGSEGKQEGSEELSVEKLKTDLENMEKDFEKWSKEVSKGQEITSTSITETLKNLPPEKLKEILDEIDSRIKDATESGNGEEVEKLKEMKKNLEKLILEKSNAEESREKASESKIDQAIAEHAKKIASEGSNSDLIAQINDIAEKIGKSGSPSERNSLIKDLDGVIEKLADRGLTEEEIKEIEALIETIYKKYPDVDKQAMMNIESIMSKILAEMSERLNVDQLDENIGKALDLIEEESKKFHEIGDHEVLLGIKEQLDNIAYLLDLRSRLGKVSDINSSVIRLEGIINKLLEMIDDLSKADKDLVDQNLINVLNKVNNRITDSIFGNIMKLKDGVSIRKDILENIILAKQVVEYQKEEGIEQVIPVPKDLGSLKIKLVGLGCKIVEEIAFDENTIGLTIENKNGVIAEYFYDRKSRMLVDGKNQEIVDLRDIASSSSS